MYTNVFSWTNIKSINCIHISVHGEKASICRNILTKEIYSRVYIIYIYVEANLHKDTCMYKYEKLC